MKNYLYIATTAVLYGFLLIIYKLVDLPEIVQNFYRFLFAAIVLYAFLIYRSKKIKIHKKSFWLLVILAIANIGSATLAAIAVDFTLVSNVTFIFYTFPLLVAMVSPFIFKERTYTFTVVSLVLSIIGIYFLVDPASLKIDLTSLKGLLLSFSAAICYSVVILTSKKLSQEYGGLMLAFLQSIIMAIILFPVNFVYDYNLSLYSLSLLLIMGVLISGIGAVLLFTGIKKVPANQAGIIMYLEPLTTTVLGYIVFAEFPSIYGLIGGLLIILSGYIVINGGLKLKRGINV